MVKVSGYWGDMSPDGRSNGANLMKKMSGARDPMIQMIGEEDNYIGDAIFQSVPTEKKPQFEEVKKRRGSLDKYLKRTRVALGSED